MSFDGPGPEHMPSRIQRDHEHGREWETCLDCGAQWDADSGEQVSDGDGWCLDNAE